MKCACLLPLVLSSSLFAQAQWSEVTGLGTTIPPTRRENPAAADLTSMYVFGGTDPNGVRRNDLWRFDGAAWTELSSDGAPGSPSGRNAAAVAWDHANQQLVIFGGNDTMSQLGDTWTWDSTNGWVAAMPVSSPPARDHGKIAFDAANNSVLLFGGRDGSGVDLNDTWSWDGSNWTQLNPTTSPGPRRQHGMTERLDQDDIVMTCGQVGNTRLDDTWIWDGSDWSQVMTSQVPTPRVALDMTYDATRGRVIIAGGNNVGQAPVGNIAEFDGSDWVNLTPDSLLGTRTRYFLAYISTRGRTYLFGGQNPPFALPTGTFQYFDDSTLGSNYCVSTVNSTGSAMEISGLGSLSVGANNLTLVAGPAPNQPGLFFYGPNQVQLPFGEGFRCVGGQVVRLPALTPTLGEFNYMVDNTMLPPQGQLTAGSTWNFQAWYRDPAGGGTNFNLSNGLELTFLP